MSLNIQDLITKTSSQYTSTVVPLHKNTIYIYMDTQKNIHGHTTILTRFHVFSTADKSEQ